MNETIFLGLLYHWIGGLASASFYIPFRGVKKWSWETYWLVGGFFSWLIAPWVLASFLVPDVVDLLRQTPLSTLGWSYFFGCLWGLGGLTFGLTMRYLGIALGMAVALGFCAAFGTLMPPLFKGEMGVIFATTSGQWILIGVGICLLGITFSGAAGMSKEKELPEAEKTKVVKEFNFWKGIGLALFSGVMSASMSYGFEAGRPLAALTAAHLGSLGKMDIWQNLPVLIVVLAGGFSTNFIWCLFLHYRHRSGGEYWGRQSAAPDKTTLLFNYVFSACAGVTWYFQFFFYSMGETKMGAFKFSSWTLHMASIIIFSTLWGVVLHEWKGTSRRTHLLIAIGLVLLIISTIVIGYGNSLGNATSGH